MTKNPVGHASKLPSRSLARSLARALTSEEVEMVSGGTCCGTTTNFLGQNDGCDDIARPPPL
jgi:hypothetical protein